MPDPKTDWKVFTGVPDASRPMPRLPEPPQWRAFAKRPRVTDGLPVLGEETSPRGKRIFSEPEIHVINAAILLRRPLLVEGVPGTGKSSIAYAIARELQLGPVLKWSVTSRSTIRDGTHRYDALRRLHDANRTGNHDVPAGDYITLEPLGVALYPQDRPRVLLIDELDKGDIDLPNDLLHVLDTGMFRIDELQEAGPGVGRAHPEEGEETGESERPETNGFTVLMERGDGVEPVPVPADRTVRCAQYFPIIVITTNREREFPPAFLRRCLRLETQLPSDKAELLRILEAHQLNGELDAASAWMEKFVERVGTERKVIATDQLLNAVYLATQAGAGASLDAIIETVVMKELGES